MTAGSRTAAQTLQPDSRGQELRGRRLRRARLPVTIHSVHSHAAVVRAIGARGVVVASDETLPVDSRVELEFRFPSTGRALRLMGEVRSAAGDMVAPGEHSGPTMGIEFWNVGAEAREYLRSILENHESRSLH